MKYTTFCDIIKQYPNEKVQVFIDGANLYKTMKDLMPDCYIDYYKLGFKLCGPRKIVRINCYLSELNPEWESEKARKQQSFLSTIRKNPFITVRTRPLRYSPDKQNKWEKGVDILIATDMLIGAFRNCYDSLMLVSGDGDFAPVLNEIKEMGKRVENAFFAKSRSSGLISSCDIFIPLDNDFLSDCIRERKKPSS